MAEETKGEIVFGKEEVSPEQAEAYRKRIAAARGGVNALKGSEPLGGVPRPIMPDFQKIREAGSTPSGMTEDGGIAPRPAGSPILRPETAQQLKDMAEAQKEMAAKEAEKKKEEEDPFKKDEENLFDLLNSDQRNEAERLMNNKKRREEIEARCAPMKFEDLLFKNEVHQKVPIIPDKFEPTFRSITPEESLFVKRYIAKEQSVSDQYLLEKYNLCLLTCALMSINDIMLTDHRDNKGEPDEKLFEAKLKSIFKKSGYIVADLGVNYTWFDIRVRKLITADGLKNG